MIIFLDKIIQKVEHFKEVIMSDTGSLVDKVTELVGLPRELVISSVKFVGKLLENPLSELSGILYDDIRYLRVKNQVNLLTKAEAYFIKKGLNPKSIPAKTLVPLLEYSSLEEDVTLQGMWESIFINAIHPTGRDVISGYIDILKQLSVDEAKLLSFIYQEFSRSEFEGISLKEYLAEFDLEESFDLYIDNFIRLNLIENVLPYKLLRELAREENQKQFRSMGGSMIPFPDSTNYWSLGDKIFRMTRLGTNFVIACDGVE